MKRICILVMTGFFALSIGTAWGADEDEDFLKQQLGKHLFFDKISSPDSMSCAECHGPEVGFTGPVPGTNMHGAVYQGAVPQRFGNRKPPSAAYATFSPIFHYDTSEGLFVGGNFWDGRATGENLGNPAADQALGPFLNPVEMANPNKLAVCKQVAASKYADLWESAWGDPIDCDNDLEQSYNRIGLSIAAYEASDEVNAFSSKYDLYLDGKANLTEQEALGLTLFNGEAKCANCHPSGESKALFTDFTFDNLGVPKNPENPFYAMDKIFLDDGSQINPDGIGWVDEGLGGFLKNRDEWEALAAENIGKQKVPTLRNVGKAPGKTFPKAYGHNGYFKSLWSIVHFYNTRDVKDQCPDQFTTEAEALKLDCWPAPEVAENINMDELGNLRLSSKKEDAIVAFLKTLSDGYIP